jgi:hypothetical protein
MSRPDPPRELKALLRDLQTLQADVETLRADLEVYKNEVRAANARAERLRHLLRRLRTTPAAQPIARLPVRQVAIAYLLILTVCEVMTTLVLPTLGMTAYSLLLVALLFHAALTADYPIHRLLMTLTLAPMIRLLSLSLPLAELPQIYWYLVIGLPLFVPAFFTMRFLRLSGGEMGLRLGQPGTQGLIASSGVLLGLCEYVILRPDPLMTEFHLPQFIFYALIMLVCTGFMEEFIFRGLMQQTSIQTLGESGIVYVAVIFAVMHVGYQSLLDVIFVLVVGLFFGWIVRRTGSLSGVTVAHGLTNICLFLIIPLWVR